MTELADANGETAPDAQTEQEFLAAYDPRAFSPAAVTVDVALLTLLAGQLSVLLVERSEHPYQGSWALPGGFLRERETLDEAARRELADETGVRAFSGHVEQLASYGDPQRDPRMRVVSVAYLAVSPDRLHPVADTDAAFARFWPVADLALAEPSGAALNLAFDHAQIVRDAVERTRAKLEYSSLATAFCDEPFTIADLRRVYEAVWGTRLDPANFQRKILAANDLIVPLGAHASTTSTGGRPARLYRAGTAQLLQPPLLRVHAYRSETRDRRRPTPPSAKQER